MYKYNKYIVLILSTIVDKFLHLYYVIYIFLYEIFIINNIKIRRMADFYIRFKTLLTCTV